MTKQQRFQIGSTHKIAIAPPRDRTATDECHGSRRNDQIRQDIATHLDFWVGVAALVCSPYPLFKAQMIAIEWIPNQAVATAGLAVYAIGVIGFLALIYYGVLFGIVNDNRRGKGTDSIFMANGDPNPFQAEIDAATPADRCVGGRAVGLSSAWLFAWFTIEAVLIFFGIVVTGWLQWLLGAIAFVIIVVALITSLNRRAERNAVDAAIQMAAAAKVERGGIAPRTQAEIARDRKAEIAANKEAMKQKRMTVLTIIDFSLAVLGAFSLYTMSWGALWAEALASLWFMMCGIWLMFVGHTTGYGNPGGDEHYERDDHADFVRQRSVVRAFDDIHRRE